MRGRTATPAGSGDDDTNSPGIARTRAVFSAARVAVGTNQGGEGEREGSGGLKVEGVEGTLETAGGELDRKGPKGLGLFADFSGARERVTIVDSGSGGAEGAIDA